MLVDWSFLASAYKKAQQNEFWIHWGLVGDTVGGIFGTIITAISIILLYRTLRATNTANARAHFRDIFSQMISTHQRAAGVLYVKDDKGRDRVSMILKEFYQSYNSLIYILERYRCDHIPQIDRINISWVFTYYGPSDQCQSRLARYPKHLIDGVHGQLCAIREEPRYKGYLIGNQSTLGHYFRNLFAIYNFMNNFDSINKKEKYDFAKIVRVQLSKL